MRPASLRRGVQFQHFLVFVVRFAGRPERSHVAGVDRGGVRRAKPHGGPDFVVGVGVARVGGEALAGERQRVSERVVERRDRLGRRRRKSGFRPCHTAHVVVDRHVAAPERNAQPQRAGQTAIGAGVPRVGGDGLLVEVLCAIAIQVMQMAFEAWARSATDSRLANPLAGTPATISVSDSAVTVFRGRTPRFYAPFALARACTFCIQLPVTVAKIGCRPPLPRGRCAQNVP